MYHLIQENEPFSFSFRSDFKVNYLIFFSSQEALFPEKEYAPHVFYFGFVKKENEENSELKVNDPKVKLTVVGAVISFFSKMVSKPILVFNYRNDDGKGSARKRIFQQWFDEFVHSNSFHLVSIEFKEVCISILYQKENEMGIGFKMDLLKYFEELDRDKN